MDPVLAEFLKFTMVGVGAGILVLIVMVVKPKKFKLGNIIEAEFADKDAGSVAINIDGSKRILIPADLVDQVIIQTEKMVYEIDEDQKSYIEKTLLFAQEKIRSISFDVAAMLDSPAGKCEDKDYAELVILNTGMIRDAIEVTVMEALRRSIRANGFYSMIHYDKASGQKIPKPEWNSYIETQAETVYSIIKHTIGNKISFVQAGDLQPSTDNRPQRTAAESVMIRAGRDFNNIKDVVEKIYNVAWEHQRIYKEHKERFAKWKSSIAKSLREEGKYLTPESD
jgi:hypothetical protein